MNVVLVQPEIPPNTGNVARLCAATKSVLHLIEPFGFKLDDSQLKRAGMDYWQHVEWHRWPNWNAFMHDFLSEREALHQKYYATRRLDEQLDSVITADGFAIAITKLVFIDSKIRYRLRPVNDSWMIEDWNVRCRPCQGTGRTTDIRQTCPKCKGTGWKGLNQ